MTFGDHDPDDSYAPAPPDPEQVAARIAELRARHEPGARPWAQLSVDERAVAIVIIADVLAWLRRQGTLR